MIDLTDDDLLEGATPDDQMQPNGKTRGNIMMQCLSNLIKGNCNRFAEPTAYKWQLLLLGNVQ